VRSSGVLAGGGSCDRLRRLLVLLEPPFEPGLLASRALVGVVEKILKARIPPRSGDSDLHRLGKRPPVTRAHVQAEFGNGDRELAVLLANGESHAGAGDETDVADHDLGQLEGHVADGAAHLLAPSTGVAPRSL
jgi:hypothetical protein